jgi:hypothetical protein
MELDLIILLRYSPYLINELGHGLGRTGEIMLEFNV